MLHLLIAKDEEGRYPAQPDLPGVKNDEVALFYVSSFIPGYGFAQKGNGHFVSPSVATDQEPTSLSNLISLYDGDWTVVDEDSWIDEVIENDEDLKKRATPPMDEDLQALLDEAIDLPFVFPVRNNPYVAKDDSVKGDSSIFGNMPKSTLKLINGTMVPDEKQTKAILKAIETLVATWTAARRLNKGVDREYLKRLRKFGIYATDFTDAKKKIEDFRITPFATLADLRNAAQVVIDEQVLVALMFYETAVARIKSGSYIKTTLPSLEDVRPTPSGRLDDFPIDLTNFPIAKSYKDNEQTYSVVTRLRYLKENSGATIIDEGYGLALTEGIFSIAPLVAYINEQISEFEATLNEALQ